MTEFGKPRPLAPTDVPLSESLLRKAGWTPGRQVSEKQVQVVTDWWQSMGILVSDHALRVVSSLWYLTIPANEGKSDVLAETAVFDMPQHMGKPYLPIDHDIIELLVEEGFAGPSTPAPVARLISNWDVVLAINEDGRCFAVLAESDLWCEWRSLDLMIYGIANGRANFTRKRGLFPWLPDEPNSQ